MPQVIYHFFDKNSIPKMKHLRDLNPRTLELLIFSNQGDCLNRSAKMLSYMN